MTTRTRFVHRGVGLLLTLLTLTAVLFSSAVVVPTGRPGSATVAEASTLASLPTSIAQWLLKWVGQYTGKKLVQQQGFVCLPLTSVSSCYTSYDPPIWAGGTADTGGPAYYLRARSWTSTTNSIVNNFGDGSRFTIYCQTQGDWVYGRWGWTNVWDFIGMGGDVPMFVSDGFVNTGSNGFVAGGCASTDYGGMAW